MASSFQIKRSANVAAPTTTDLATSELAYSQDKAGDGAGAVLYIESIDSNNNPVIHKVGGKFFTDLLLAATSLANANTIVRRDAVGSFKTNYIIGNLFGTANTALSTSFANLSQLSNVAVVAGTANALTNPFTLQLVGDASGNVTINGSSNVTMNVTVLGGSGNSGNAGNANVAAYAIRAERANSATVANVANLALSANFANVAATANTATSATTAVSATTATSATFANYATTAGKADSTDLASLANVATTAVSATTANLSLTSNFATLANSANIATNANNAINATIAVNATNATKANSATIANTANNAINANVSIFATTAGFANSATIANSANISNNSNIAIFAQTAGFANSATIANTANNAINATTATNAISATIANSANVANSANNSINANTAVFSTSAGISNTANAWATARNLRVLGDASGNVLLDGTSNANLTISVAYAPSANIANVSLTSNIATYALSANVANNANNSINATLAVSATNATKANSATIANTANTWTTARTIRVMGDAVGNVTIDGSANANLVLAITNIINSVAIADRANSLTNPFILQLGGSASGNVSISGNANVTMNVAVSSATFANSATIANTANNAINANVSIFATTAGFANSATIANSANNSINATTATFATSAGISNTANSAINAGFANSATIANTANSAINATVSAFATNASNANVALFAQNADTAAFAILALSANVADTANFAAYTGSTAYANFAESCNTAVISSFSVAAADATNAGYAVTATSANYATLAEKANSATITDTANTWTTPRTVSLSGVISGSASVDGSSDVNINTSINMANVNVALGDNTSGDYVRNVIAGFGMVATGQGGEQANVTVALANTSVVASTYGGSRKIPSYVVDSAGRIMSSSNIDIVTDVLFAGNSGSNTLTTGQTLKIVGVDRISTAIVGNTVTITDSGIVKLDGTTNQLQVTSNVGNVVVSFPNNVNFPGNVTIPGQLNVLGNITTTNFVTITTADVMIKLANNNTVSDVVDLGFYGPYNNGGVKFGGFVRDATDGVWKLFKDITTEPGNTVNFGGTAIASLQANLSGANVISLNQPLNVADGGTGNTTFKTNSVITGNVNNKFDSVTGTEDQALYIVNGIPAFKTVADAPAALEYIVNTANTKIPNARVIEAGNCITLDKTIAGKVIIKREALIGDVTSPINSNTLTIANGVVTPLKQSTVPGKSFLINPLSTTNTLSTFTFVGNGKLLGTNDIGNIDLLTLGSGLSVTGNVITATGGGSGGNTILSGSVDPTGATGSDNSFYYNKSNAFFYGPKTAGTWPAGVNMKGRPGWEFIWTTNTVNSDPTATKAKLNAVFDANITMLRISITDANNVNRSNHITAISPNGTIDIAPLSSSGTSMLRLQTTGNVALIGGTYYNIPCKFLSGTRPGEGEPVAILYTPGPNIQWDDVSQVLRNSSGVEISNPLIFNTTFDIPPAANMTNKAGIVVNNGFPYAAFSDGNVISTIGVERLHAYSGKNVRRLILVSTGLSWTVSNVAGLVRLTSAGAVAHGLTTANAINTGNVLKNSIKISGGTGWTANSFHEINAITATTIDLNTPFTSQGAPTVVAANTEVEILKISIPVLKETSVLRACFGIATTTSTIGRRIITYVNDAIVTNFNHASTNRYIPFESGFANQGQTNLQRGIHGLNSTGAVSALFEPTETNTETGTGNNTFSINFLVSGADAPVELCNYSIYLRDA